jgi:hypothetical protein
MVPRTTRIESTGLSHVSVEKRYELLDETIDLLSAFHFCM